MVAASLACLSQGGAFVEVGKRDIWSPQRVAQERPDVKYHLIAIDFWEPSVVGSSLQRLAAMLAKGDLYIDTKHCQTALGLNSPFLTIRISEYMLRRIRSTCSFKSLALQMLAPFCCT